jgi:hypothetical protein
VTGHWGSETATRRTDVAGRVERGLGVFEAASDLAFVPLVVTIFIAVVWVAVIAHETRTRDHSRQQPSLGLARAEGLSGV